MVCRQQGIDLYIPALWSVVVLNSDGTYSNILGRSALPGPCPDDKDAAGPVGASAGLLGTLTSSRSVSHEVGHYLGLPHQNSSPTNLMCQTGSASSPTWQQVALTGSQDGLVTSSCMVAK